MVNNKNLTSDYHEKQWRKKPVVITARRMSEAFEVKTLEGVMQGEPGDWLITGVAGEQYPCKDEIFRKTYEPVLPEELPVLPD